MFLSSTSFKHFMTIIFECYSEKDRELGVAQGEIKALRGTEALKEKAIEEVIKNHMQTLSLTVSTHLCKLSGQKRE
jgi:hypothetical protein